MGYLFAIIGAVLFGANGSTTKVVIDAGISPAQITFVRVLSVALIAAVWLLVSNRRAFRISGRQLAIMAVLGIIGVALLQWSYAIAVSLLPVGVALLLEYLSVLIVAIFALVVFKEQVRARLWTAIALVLAGLALVAELGASGFDAVGVLFGLIAAVSISVYFLVGERQVASSSPLAVAFWSMAFAAAFWAIFSGWWRIEPALLASNVSLEGSLSAIRSPVWLLLIVTGVLGTFAPFLFSFLALKHLRATAAGIASSAEVIFAFLFAYLWLGEVLAPIQLIGIVLVIGGIVIAQTARRHRGVDADLASEALARRQNVP